GADGYRIYTLEKDVLGHGEYEHSDVEEQAGLMQGRAQVDIDPNLIFSKALDKELDKIVAFYRQKEVDLYDEVRVLQIDAANYQALKNRHESDGSYGPTPAQRNRRASAASMTRTRSNTSGDPRDFGDSDEDADEHGALIEHEILRKNRQS